MDVSGGKFSLWSVLVIVATVASAAAGASWQVGRSRMQDELDQYRRSVDLGLPETLKEMRDLGKRLTTSLEERKQLAQVADLRSQNKVLQKNLAALEQELKSARNSLAALEGDTFTVLEDRTRVVVSGKLALGIDDAYSSTCVVQLGKERKALSLGEPIEAIEGGITYRLILLDVVDSAACKFSLSKEASA